MDELTNNTNILQNFFSIITPDEVASKSWEIIKSIITKNPLVFYSHECKYNLSTKLLVNDKPTYIITKYLTNGTYNEIYLLTNGQGEYIYRVNNYTIEVVSDFINILIEKYVHYWLSTNYPEYFVKLIDCGLNKQKRTFNSIVEKMNGTVHTLMKHNFYTFEHKLILIIRVIKEISKILEHLQKELGFVHHDLKMNNVFYRLKNKEYGYSLDNIQFILGDVDSSRINISGNIIMSELTHAKDKSLCEKRDLFIFIHSLKYTLSGKNWQSRLFNKFPLYDVISQEDFHALYGVKEDDISEVFTPSNMLKRMETTNFFP